MSDMSENQAPLILVTPMDYVASNLTFTTLFPIVGATGNIIGSATLQAMGNQILTGAGGLYYPPAAQANVAQTVTTNAQPNITSVGTLTNLVVIGNVTAGNINSSNIVNARFYYGDAGFLSNANVSNIAGLGNIATINLNNNINTVLSGNGTWVMAGTGGLTNTIFYGSSSVDIPVSDGDVTISANGVANAVVISGTDTYITGNIAAANGVFTNVTGDGANLSNISGANVTGIVTYAYYSVVTNFANYAAAVTNTAQPNITSLGTLANLIVSGPVNLGSISNVTVSGGSDGQYLKTDGAGNLAWSTISNLSIAGGADTQLQFNANGVLGGIPAVTWNGSTLSLGNAANVKMTGGSAGYFLQTDGAGNLSWSGLGGGNTNIGNITFYVSNISTNINNGDLQLISNGLGNINVLSNKAINLSAADLHNTDGGITLEWIDTANNSIGTIGINDSGFANGAGNVSIFSQRNGFGSLWIFDPTGNLTLPGNMFQINYANGTQVQLGGNITNAPEPSFNIRTANFTAAQGSRYGVDTTSIEVTATLPASPVTGGAIYFADAGGTYATNNLIINPNGQTIMGTSGNMTVSTNDQSFGLFYNGTTWRTY
jgi:hypothetical protein